MLLFSSLWWFYNTSWVNWWLFRLPLAHLGGERENASLWWRPTANSRGSITKYRIAWRHCTPTNTEPASSEGIVTFIMDQPTLKIQRNPILGEQKKRKRETDRQRCQTRINVGRAVQEWNWRKNKTENRMPTWPCCSWNCKYSWVNFVILFFLCLVAFSMLIVSEKMCLLVRFVVSPVCF